MAGLGDFVQKAFYLGVGIAASAGEKAGDLRVQVQKLADEMVIKGEITAEEARKLVDNMLAAQQVPTGDDRSATAKSSEPRRIEIQDEESSPVADDKVARMRRQVEELQEQLQRLKKQ
jgi:polyhydroxyalkanoate synthesis regulator phasin